MESSLNGRKALVTGGAGGIGAASVRALAARGAKVVIADVDEAAAAALADEVGGTSWAVNLLDVETLQAVSLDCDILVNNAGIQRISPIEDFDPADFRRLITLMLEAPFLLIRAALPHMYANNFGRIINLSSVHGLRASPFKSAYVSAKHGLEGLSKVTALEGGAHGVTSNCINPGYVRTPLVESQIADQAKVHGIPEVRSARQDHADRGRGEAARRAGGGRLPCGLAGLRRRRYGHRRQLHDGRRLVRAVTGRPAADRRPVSPWSSSVWSWSGRLVAGSVARRM